MEDVKKQIEWIGKAKLTKSKVKKIVAFTLTKNNQKVSQAANNKLRSLSETKKGQLLLAKIAKKTEEYGDIRYKSMQSISDQKILSNVIKKIFSTILDYSLDEDFINEIARIKDQELLLDIVCKSNQYGIREFEQVKEKIVARIHDEKALTVIAQKYSVSSGIQIKAVEKISDQELLKSIVMKCWNTETKFMALHRITNQDIKKYLAKNCKDKMIKKELHKEIENMKTQAKYGNDPIIKEFHEIDWIKMIKENTDLNNPKLGNLRWSYGVSQREIIAKYNNWQLKGIYDMSKSGNYVFLEIVHSSGYKNQIYDTGLSDFLFKIF